MSVRTITLVVVLLTSSTGLRAADDPLMGNWKLNVSKSKYETGKPPKIYTRTHEAIPNGMKVAREEVDAAGQVFHPAWTAKFDGKDYPIQGEPGGFVDSLYLKRLDPYTVVGGSKKNGVLINELRWEVSKDGKTLPGSRRG